MDHAWRLLEAGSQQLGWSWHVLAVQDVALTVPQDTVRAALIDAAAGVEYADTDTGISMPIWSMTRQVMCCEMTTTNL